MENKRILITGGKGYLASNLVHHLDKSNDISMYEGDVRYLQKYNDIDVILHFACPSERQEFRDKSRTVGTIIDGTINMLNLAKYNNAKLIYASTMGVYHTNPEDIYTTCKLAMEQYITSLYNNYLILRIPRVYSRCRDKGLMKTIKQGQIIETDLDNMINFITLSEFIEQTLQALDKQNITHEYDVNNTLSIREIIKWVKE